MTTRKETESETKTMWVYLFGFLFCLTSILFGYFRSGHNKEKNKTKQNEVTKVMLTWMRGWRKVGGQINYNVIK